MVEGWEKHALARKAYEPVIGQMMQKARNDLAHAAEFVGDRLVRHLKHPAPSEQERGQPLIQPTEGYRLDQCHHVAEPRGEQCEDIGAEALLRRHQLPERPFRQEDQPGFPFHHAACRVGSPSDQAAGGEHAGIPRMNPVQEDLATRSGRLGHPDRAVEQERHRLAGRVVIEQHGTRRHGQRARPGEGGLEDGWRQRAKHRIPRLQFFGEARVDRWRVGGGLVRHAGGAAGTAPRPCKAGPDTSAGSRRSRRIALPTTSSELADMPIAATHGVTRPAIANGTATRL